MRQSDPPRAATWMLRHLVPGERNDALAGDLLEEFRAGRSAAWYWRQVLACIAIMNTRVVVAQTGALLFAALWALLYPAWLSITRIGAIHRLGHATLSEPWSIVCGLGLSFLVLISFVWAGLLLYLVLEALTLWRFSLQRLRRGILRSVAVFAPLYAAFISLPLILFAFGLTLSQAAHHSAEPPICAPLFITLLWATWDTSRTTHSRKPPMQNRFAE